MIGAYRGNEAAQEQDGVPADEGYEFEEMFLFLRGVGGIIDVGGILPAPSVLSVERGRVGRDVVCGDVRGGGCVGSQSEFHGEQVVHVEEFVKLVSVRVFIECG